jgi:hypothetical protein
MMRSGVERARGAPGRVGVAAERAGAILLLAGALAGCASGGSASFGGPNSTIAFEAIDGPPPEIFEKLVAKLNDEAQARQIPVVARAAPAQYRVRGYVSAQIDRKRNTIAWVWDIYDGEERRALRIGGQEPAGRARRDAWASADDKVLARIAQSGMAQIAQFLNAGAPAAPASPGSEPGVAVAQAALPEAAAEAAEGSPPVVLAQVPVPRSRPDTGRALTEDDLIRYAASRR